MSADRPRIGVTRWEDVPAERIADYWERIDEAGGDVVDLDGTPADAEGLDALVLTGGLDVAPEAYDATPHPKVKRTDPARDDFELKALSDAVARDLPVLAICRGHQLLNVAFGGGLLQHIEGDGHRAHKRDGAPSRWHSIRLMPGSRLRELLGGDEIEVNSRHHQAVLAETLAPGLTPVATSHDGIIEAVQSLGHAWVLGVQWHPERPETDHPGFLNRSRLLFAALVAEARAVGTRA